MLGIDFKLEVNLFGIFMVNTVDLMRYIAQTMYQFNFFFLWKNKRDRKRKWYAQINLTFGNFDMRFSD